VAELGSHVARTGNQNLAGDAIAATLLAEAAGQAAARLVRINLGDNPLVREATELARRARFAREEALN
jgi:methenyltetrahydrofolate cyclohydrolase